MRGMIVKAGSFFETPITLSGRIWILIGVIVMVPVFFLPLWQMELYSNQFPDGLILKIHATQLEGGKTPNRDDLKEINSLNHYIGMRELKEDDFTEFKWIPFVLGGMVLLALRAMVLGKMSKLVDLIVVFAYFGLFSMWSFYHKLYLYGHELDPTAAIKIPPFTPPMFGHKTMANFEVYNYPNWGSLFMGLMLVCLLIAVWTSRKAWLKGTKE